jgi:hypothetical protein
MNRIDRLLENYRSHVQMPLRSGLASSQRVWFAVYPAQEERRLQNRIDDFEIVTKDSGNRWMRVDLSGRLAQWLATIDQDERDEWFKHPGDIDLYAKTEWKAILVEVLTLEFAKALEPRKTIFAVTGLTELYDFVHVSDLIEGLGQTFPGHLLLFFPGEKEGNTYRFLDARAGWDYLATPILSER